MALINIEEALEKLRKANLPEEVKLQAEEAIKNCSIAIPIERKSQKYLLLYLNDWEMVKVEEFKDWGEK